MDNQSSAKKSIKLPGLINADDWEQKAVSKYRVWRDILCEGKREKEGNYFRPKKLTSFKNLFSSWSYTQDHERCAKTLKAEYVIKLYSSSICHFSAIWKHVRFPPKEFVRKAPEREFC